MGSLVFPRVRPYTRTGVRALGLYYEPEHDHSIAILLEEAARKSDGHLRWELSLPKRPASRGPGSQLNHIHGHCSDIAEQLGGYTSEEVKAAMKRMAVSEGYPTRLSIDGVETPISLSTASVEDAIVVIDVIHRFASEHRLWLTEKDEQSGATYRSIGGHSMQEMADGVR